MKHSLVGLMFMLALVSPVGAQTKSMTGTVIETDRGMYKWEAIVVQVGTKKYYVYTLSGTEKSPRTVGTVDEVGRTVRVFYTSIVREPGYAGRLKATRIVEIKSSAPQATSGSSDRVSVVGSQTPRVICDGRSEASVAEPSGADVQFLRLNALPRARRTRLASGCLESFNAISTAFGSFTIPGRSQRALLYRYCETGHNFATNGVVVLEGTSIVAHVMWEGGSDWGMRALGDINGNGTEELVLFNSTTHQGYANDGATLIDLSGGGFVELGGGRLGEDNAGTDRPPLQQMAYRILVKEGASPAFFCETYRRRKGQWVRQGPPVPYSPEKWITKWEIVR